MKNIKKIGIITYWPSLDNYGQMLQCFALQKFLIKNNCSPFLIKFSPNNQRNFLEKILSKLSIKKIYRFISGERAKQKEQAMELTKAWNVAREKAKKCHFDSFREHNLDSTSNIYSTIFEGFGMTAIEMMGRKVPTIVAESTAMPEVTLGLCKYYSPTSDSHALAQTILEELNNPMDGRRLEEISQTVKAQYNIKKIATDYWDFFNRCIEE